MSYSSYRMMNIAKYKQLCSMSFTYLCKLMTLLILFKTCNLQLTLSQLIPKSYPLDFRVIHLLPHVLYKELNHHLTLSQMIPKSCPTGPLVELILITLTIMKDTIPESKRFGLIFKLSPSMHSTQSYNISRIISNNRC